MTTAVLLVDDHPVVRRGLRAVLETEPGLHVVGEADTGAQAIERTRMLTPDVVLCDLRLGDGADGIHTTAALRRLRPAPAVIILTTSDHDADVRDALEAGAAGYLLKDAAPQMIVHAIRAAASGEIFLAPDVAARVLDGVRTPLPRLTTRESDVLRLLSTGSANREIARSLGVTRATVKSHLESIFDKLDVDSRSRAIRRARELGLL